MRQYVSHAEADTARIAAEVCAGLRPGAVVAFFGGMGMGKTAFVRGAMKAFGNPAFVSSPTFALVHDYGGEPRICHFDMYRVQDPEDLYEREKRLCSCDFCRPAADRRICGWSRL